MDVREWDFQRGYIEVNLDHILHKMEQMKQHIHSHTKMLAVVKTDGYGHGSVPIAKAVEGLEYLFGFAVATAEEALELRKAGIEKPAETWEEFFEICDKLLAAGITPLSMDTADSGWCSSLLLGAIIGTVAFFFVPGVMETSNVLVAIVVGAASGLSATGTNQVVKQLTKPKTTDTTTTK